MTKATRVQLEQKVENLKKNASLREDYIMKLIKREHDLKMEILKLRAALDNGLSDWYSSEESSETEEWTPEMPDVIEVIDLTCDEELH